MVCRAFTSMLEFVVSLKLVFYIIRHHLLLVVVFLIFRLDSFIIFNTLTVNSEEIQKKNFLIRPQEGKQTNPENN